LFPTTVKAKAKTFLTSSVESELLHSIAAAIGPGTVIVTMLPEARYRQLAAGSWVRRAWLRFLTHVIFPLKLAFKARRSPRDSVWIVSTNPFHAPACVLAEARRRGCKMVHLVFDLYPDALEAAGISTPDSKRSRKIADSTRRVQAECDGAVYLGELLRSHAEARYGAAKISAVIDAAANGSRFVANKGAGRLPLALHYGGQLGAMHDTDSLLAAIVGTKRDRADGLVSFDFRVSGSGARRLAAVNGSEGVTIGPPMAFEEWRVHASNFQIGIVTLSPAGALACLPSKAYGLMAAGCAILAICPAWSDLGRLVRETSCGWVIDNSVVDEAPRWDANGIDSAHLQRRPGMEVGNEIASILHRILVTPDRIAAFGANAFTAAQTTFGRSSMSAAWQDFLSKIRYSKPE
jgi:hypothetical protein